MVKFSVPLREEWELYCIFIKLAMMNPKNDFGLLQA